jgi:hypothetical protein
VADHVDLDEPRSGVVPLAHVRIGIASLSSDLRLLWLRPCGNIGARSVASRRSIVAVDSRTRTAAITSLQGSSPDRRSHTFRAGSTGGSRLSVGAPRTAR